MKPGTAVTITDPFVKYTSLIATRVYQPDAAQYRLAHHLQKVYTRLKDYTPSHEYRRRIGLISKAIDEAHSGSTGRDLASPTHPIRRNPLFARFFSRNDSSISKETLALARVLTSYQAALHVDSPKGLFLSGEVGTGKSMLLDLLADGLPNRHKRRWHFNTFMLHALARLEAFRKARPHLSDEAAPEYPLLWLAKELIETSPILFLDEFQLPDRAASKIMSHLFVAFFQLGGVLVASSNRMPEELEKAAGGYFQPPATGGLIETLLATLTVYGRRLTVPHQHAGVSSWDFSDLVNSLGPADYVTLASNYHTFIIDKVPVLTLSMKNEARRFITLLDALYEARCKLVMRAAAGPDGLFFPETQATTRSAREGQDDDLEADLADATYSETMAEVYQDQIAPFRPNVSYYADAPDSSSPATIYDPHQETDLSGSTKGPDFTKTTPFTGEDERFAYKRATSRLWELCSARWHARSGEGWWMPLPREARHWEGGEVSRPMPSALDDVCEAYFPGLTKEVDDMVAKGPFEVKQTGDLGPLQGRIQDGQLYIIHAQRKSDLSTEMLNSRTASLHQLHRAMLTSPSPLPDTIFSLNFQDQPFGTAWTYSRHADPQHASHLPNARSFLMPHFSFWAWDLPFIGSMSRAAKAITALEAEYASPRGRWGDKISKAVWRGTTWFNSVHSPGMRQKLVKTAQGQPWADVEPLDWGNGAGGNGNATNALPIEGFCRYKYVIHTEGIAYSGRFQFLQMCASVVLTPPILWMQHVTHLAKPLFSSELEHGGKKWTPTERTRRAWPVGYKPEEANIVFVAPDWSDLAETVEWLEKNPDVAEGIARRQRELFVGGGYFSPAAETCYWRALVRGWAKMARTEGHGWEETKGIPFETFSLTNTV
ncbi:hypothetical protein VTJ49DRAFT_5452 [Mycothermus thermophilus]|uniref:Glycosyl transferase CAP10 domain-containing protein n=1 Tax=Humicola insolens TaxID=85995 RepID=A0ABR3V397_HUMIN